MMLDGLEAPAGAPVERSEELPQATTRARLGFQGARFSGVVIWIVFIIVFTIWLPHTFPTTATARNILGSQGVTAVLVLGLLFTLATGQYDLSSAQNLGLSAVVASTLMVKTGISPVFAAVIAVAVGALVGMGNAILVVVIGLDSFIATLGMSSVLLALTELISKNVFVGPVPGGFQSFVSHTPLGIPVLALYALGLAIVVWYVLEHTPLGRRMFATGANVDAARLAGVPTSRLIFLSFVVTGAFAALAGVLAAAQIGEIDPTLGPPYLLPSFAACFLGTTQLKPGKLNVWGAILALLLLATGVQGLELAGGSSWVQDMFNGVALLLAVSIAIVSQRRRVSARFRSRRGAQLSPPPPAVGWSDGTEHQAIANGESDER